MLPSELQEKPLAAALEAFDSSAILGGKFDRGELTILIAPEKIVAVCQYLSDKISYNRVSAITCVDWHPREPRFEIVYHLHSLERNERVRLKCPVTGENPAIESVCSIWSGANWYEREVFDLFGVTFTNHPNLERIMMPDAWKGYPPPKPYPVHRSTYSYTTTQ